MPDQPTADPVLRHLVLAVNQAQTASVPISLSVNGREFTGELIAQTTYFAALTEGSPLFAALDPTSPLAADQYAADSATVDDEFLHLRLPPESAAEPPPVWRIRMAAVDGWNLRVADPEPAPDQHVDPGHVDHEHSQTDEPELSRARAVLTGQSIDQSSDD